MVAPTLLNSAFLGFTTNPSPTIPSFNIVAGTDRVLLVHVSVEGDSSGVSVAPTSIKIAGIDLVQVVDGQTGGAGFRNSSSIWQLLEASFPANGTHNIEMIMPSATTTMNTVALYDSLAQSTPSGSQVNSDALTNAISVSADVTTTSNANHLVFSGSSSGVNATYNSYPTGFTLINDTSQDSAQGACAYSINTGVSTLQDVEYIRSASTNRLTVSAVSYEGVVGGSGISIAPSTINSLSVSLNPVIVFNSVLSLNPLAVNSDSISLNPTLLFGGALELTPNTVNSNSSSLNPTIQFSASVDLSPSVINSLSVALNPSIEYTSALIIASQVINSSSISLDPLIEFKSLIDLNPLTVDSLSIALSPIISYGQVQNIGTVTAGFADDKYSVKYKLSGITVNFKE